MIRFEIKKIFSKTANKIGLIVLLAAIAVTCYFAISSMDYVDEEGDTHTGIAAARYLRDTKAEWEGLITEDVLREVIRQNRLINETYPDSPTDIKTSNIGYHPYTFYSSWVIGEMMQNPFSLHFIVPLENQTRAPEFILALILLSLRGFSIL